MNQALHGCQVSLVGRQVQRGGAAAGPRINVPAHTPAGLHNSVSSCKVRQQVK